MHTRLDLFRAAGQISDPQVLPDRLDIIEQIQPHRTQVKEASLGSMDNC